MEDLGGIVWRASIDTQGLTTAEKQVNRSTGRVEKDFQRTERSANQLGATMTRVAKAVGSVLAVRQIQRFVLNTAAAIDEQGKFAQQLGVSFEELQKLQFAAEQSGSSIEVLNNALRRGRRNIADAANGIGSAVDSLEELNLNAQELTRLSPDQQFRVLADAISGVEDEARQAAIAYRIFGRDGEQLLLTLRNGSQGLAELGEEAAKSGRIISQDTADAAAKFNDEMNKMQGALKGTVVEIGNGLLPVLTEVFTAFTDFLSDGEKVRRIIHVIGVAAQAAAVILLGRFVASLYASVKAMSIATIGARTLTASLALLGGPVGIIATVVAGLGLVAYHSTRAKSAQDDLTESTDLLTKSYQNLTRTQRQQMLSQIANEIAELEAQTESAKGALIDLSVEGAFSRMDGTQVQNLSEFLTGTAISAEEAEAAIQKSTDNTNIALEKREARLAKLRELYEELKGALNENTESTKSNTRANEEAEKVLTGLAQRNEELRAELDGTTEAMEIRRAIAAAGVELGSAEANVIANLIRGNRELQQAIADRAEAEQEALRIQGEFQNVQQMADYENQSPEERLRAERDARLAVIQEYSELEIATEEEVAAAKLAVHQSYSDRLRDLENQRMSMLLGQSASIFGDLSDMAKAFAGEQSGIYKGLFAASKAFSIAQSIVAIKTGIAQAAAIPFPANLGAMATVAAQTAGIISGIKGTQMGSGRLYGGNTSPGRMYPVSEDGKPELLVENGRQYLIPGARGEVVSNRNMQQGSTYNASIEMPVSLHGDYSRDNLEMIRNAFFDLQGDLVMAVEQGFNRMGREL